MRFFINSSDILTISKFLQSSNIFSFLFNLDNTISSFAISDFGNSKYFNEKQFLKTSLSIFEFPSIFYLYLDLSMSLDFKKSGFILTFLKFGILSKNISLTSSNINIVPKEILIFQHLVNSNNRFYPKFYFLFFKISLLTIIIFSFNFLQS